MAIVHQTTLSPTKLELLTAWLPAQPWYLDTGRAPELAKAGGFRLDDPQGEVGIEFMVVTDSSGERSATYLVPLTYRASALAGADAGLVGTMQHGVLGRRWAYDGAHDPVLVGQLVALIQGRATPQAQGVSDTPDPSVLGKPVTDAPLTATDSMVAASGPSGTDVRVETAGAEGSPGAQLIVRIHRSLHPDGNRTAADVLGQPCLSATWRLPDATQVRGSFVSAQFRAVPGSR